MTAQQSVEMFVSRHGDNWLAFQRDPMFRDMMEMVRAFDPARAAPDIAASSATEHAQHLLGRIAGFNLVTNLLDHGIQLPGPNQQIEATYADDNELEDKK
jgi:hypothetical protein